MAAELAAEVLENVPFGHVEQTTEPFCALYLPGTHAKQEPPSGPSKPTLQMQLAREILLDGEFESDGHARQRAEAEYEYVPSPH